MKVQQHLSSYSLYYGGVSEPKDYINISAINILEEQLI